MGIPAGTAQKVKKSKLKSSINKLEQPTKKEVVANLKYAESIFDDSIAKAVKLVESNLLVAIELQYHKEEALGYQVLGRFNYSLSNYKLASSNFDKAIAIVKKERQNAWLYELYVEAAKSQEKRKNYSQGITFFQDALSLAITSSHISNQVYCHLYLGELYLKLNQPDKAKEQFETTLKKTSSIKNQINSKIGLGRVAMAKKNYALAQSYFEKSQQLAEANDQDELANKAFDLLTQLYEKQKKTNKSIYVQEQAYQYNNSRGNVNPTLNNSANLSKNYLKQGRTQDALEIMKESKPLLKVEDNTDIKREFINTLSEVYEEQGFKEEALKEKRNYEELLDSFYLTQKQKQLIEESKNEFLLNVQNKMLLMEKDRELNEQTIELLKKDQVIQNETITRQKTITTILVIGLVIILLLGFLLLKNSRQRQRNNQLLVLKSLRNQMNPHFIFNSLNSVNSFIAKKEEKSANKYLAEFSKLMREVLECSQEDFIPLSKEIEMLKRYLNLEHFRFNSDFDFTFLVDEKIRMDNYQIPPMLLQPFVENAIWHGLRYKEEKGVLEVSFTQEKEYLKIVISDDGIGREHSKTSKTANQKKMKSTGIKNVQNRLEIIKSVFKKELVIEIEDQDKSTQKGTIVTLKLY